MDDFYFNRTEMADRALQHTFVCRGPIVITPGHELARSLVIFVDGRQIDLSNVCLVNLTDGKVKEYVIDRSDKSQGAHDYEDVFNVRDQRVGRAQTLNGELITVMRSGDVRISLPSQFESRIPDEWRPFLISANPNPQRPTPPVRVFGGEAQSGPVGEAGPAGVPGPIGALPVQPVGVSGVDWGAPDRDNFRYGQNSPSADSAQSSTSSSSSSSESGAAEGPDAGDAVLDRLRQLRDSAMPRPATQEEMVQNARQIGRTAPQTRAMEQRANRNGDWIAPGALNAAAQRAQIRRMEESINESLAPLFIGQPVTDETLQEIGRVTGLSASGFNPITGQLSLRAEVNDSSISGALQMSEPEPEMDEVDDPQSAVERQANLTGIQRECRDFLIELRIELDHMASHMTDLSWSQIFEGPIGVALEWHNAPVHASATGDTVIQSLAARIEREVISGEITEVEALSRCETEMSNLSLFEDECRSTSANISSLIYSLNTGTWDRATCLDSLAWLYRAVSWADSNDDARILSWVSEIRTMVQANAVDGAPFRVDPSNQAVALDRPQSRSDSQS